VEFDKGYVIIKCLIVIFFVHNNVGQTDSCEYFLLLETSVYGGTKHEIKCIRENTSVICITLALINNFNLLKICNLKVI
jgi:hypothetical protein